MLAELAVRDLGVIDDLHLVLGPGMTALTGETGAGKTLVVEAIELLVGGRADGVLVRRGAEDARVEGRFVAGDDEHVLARVVPTRGRSRAYIDGRMATATELAAMGAGLVDLHGQHAHQSLLSTSAQRLALDHFGDVDLGPLLEARRAVAELDGALAALGGDPRARAREVDLLRFQLADIDAAAICDGDEERALTGEEEALAGAQANRDAGWAAREALAGDGGAVDALGAAAAALAGRGPWSSIETRLRAAAVEVADAADEIRRAAEQMAEDPERLETVRARRRLLADVRRKYGETLSHVMAYAAEARTRLRELEEHDQRALVLDRERTAAVQRVDKAATTVAGARRRAAPGLARAVETRLQELALAGARFDVTVDGDDPADNVQFLLGANPGEPRLPLAKTASGGELARAMLALRLVLTQGPPTLVFDEVDAGVGGEAALAVGRALVAVSEYHQVLVVTHLPQVAAFAHEQIAVAKADRDGRTVASARALQEGERVVELSRMLSGQPESAAARDHAEELLAAASRQRGT
ncbi:MAG: DNA repair protein RecN [Acidimicrobiia bacterium]|nr:DNA repair protein RecN [Acidimicrobiia bacterium]